MRIPLPACFNTLWQYLKTRCFVHAQPQESGENLRTAVYDAGHFLPTEHQNMLMSLLDLNQACVEDIMIPKAEIMGLNLELPWNELREQLASIQYARLPLYYGTLDHLNSVVHVRHLLNLALENKLDKDNLLKISESPYFIPEATPLHTQILNFQKAKQRCGFVVDEYGEIQGLVTMDDILEEVVGEFTTDAATLSRSIIAQNDGSIVVDASITRRHLNRVQRWNLPDLGPRTLSGMIIEYLGYIPPADCCLRIGDYQIEILKVGENLIKSVRMVHTRPD